jgi:SpoVK/Ycf46/Vps4 family AAA+-type ATPase
MADIDAELVHLARLLVEGSPEDVIALLRRALSRVARRRPELSDDATAALSRLSFGSPLRGLPHAAVAMAAPLPVDLDSRLELLRRDLVVALEVEPTWPEVVGTQLTDVVEERSKEKDLSAVGLVPTRSLLFVGPPGVGKTLAARWLAFRLRWPLLTLDLAAVMNSFLGRTGSNLRAVLDYARKAQSILFLDEFDAIAKRRDDSTDVGELKRLVNVLLQEVDEWPASGLLIAATNHPELLDPAIWRRFERVVHFPSPSHADLRTAIARLLNRSPRSAPCQLADLLAALLEGQSFADAARAVQTAQRWAVVKGESETDAILQHCARVAQGQSSARRVRVATVLADLGYSQRRISELTSLSRDTIRKRVKGGPHGTRK